jgi:rsbT co-antagonist protein RsbR
MFLPTFSDPEIERRARLLFLILLILTPAFGGISLVLLALRGFNSSLFYLALGVLVSSLGLFGLLWFGYVKPAALGLVIMLGVANILGAASPEFVNIPGSYSAYGLSMGIMMLLSAFLLGWWTVLPAVILVLLGQELTASPLSTSFNGWLINTLILLSFSLVVALCARSLQHALQHSRQQELVAQAAAAQAVNLNNELEVRLRDTRTLLEQERHLRDTINQLTVPVQEIGERVLFAPLIGHIDTTRGQQIIDTVLTQIHASRAHTIIIDVQGVTTIDTSVARLLHQLIQSIQLLGATVMLTGISAQMAATVTQLGIHFRNVALYPSVSVALQAVSTPQSRMVAG